MKEKLIRALLSLVIAFALWLYVISVVSPESQQTYYNVPVVFHGSSTLESRGLILVSDSDVQLDLELSGNRTDLNLLSRDNITVLADLSGITSAGEHTIRYNISYPGTGITVLNQDSLHITVVVEEWIQREVPVEVNFSGALPDGFTVDRQNVVLDYDMITISGPKAVVSRINKASITVDLTGRTENFSQVYPVTFQDENNTAITDLAHVTVSASEIAATLKVDMIKTVDVVVEVIPGGGLTAEDITIETDRTSLTVSGAASALEGLDQITLTLDLGKLEASQVLEMDIVLPDGVTNVTNVDKVYVRVQVPELTTATFMVSSDQFRCINVPEGMEISLLTERLQVTVRGRENLLAGLQVENIFVVIDFSGAQAGTSGFYSATVQIEGLEHVGVIGEYTVWASVTAAADADEAP